MISRTEEMLLLIVIKLEDQAFGLTIRREVEALTGKLYSVGGIYVPLERLAKKGLLRRVEGFPTKERVGRPRRLYQITSTGVTHLEEARRMHEAMWAGISSLTIPPLRTT